MCPCAWYRRLVAYFQESFEYPCVPRVRDAFIAKGIDEIRVLASLVVTLQRKAQWHTTSPVERHSPTSLLAIPRAILLRIRLLEIAHLEVEILMVHRH